MLFGEFSFPSADEQFVATLLSILLLQMFVFLLFGLFINIVRLKHYNNVMILWFMLSVLSLIYYQYVYPFSSTEDFRFIFPSIIPFIYFYLTGIDFFTGRKLRIVGIFGYILAFFFIVESCLFFIISHVQQLKAILFLIVFFTIISVFYTEKQKIGTELWLFQ